MISFKQLKYFDAVARVRHFGKAAEQCAVTQPALSMQIQELEKTLGVQLIERSRNGVMLTEAGRGSAPPAPPLPSEGRGNLDFSPPPGRGPFRPPPPRAFSAPAPPFLAALPPPHRATVAPS